MFIAVSKQTHRLYSAYNSAALHLIYKYSTQDKVFITDNGKWRLFYTVWPLIRETNAKIVQIRKSWRRLFYLWMVYTCVIYKKKKSYPTCQMCKTTDSTILFCNGNKNLNAVFVCLFICLFVYFKLSCQMCKTTDGFILFCNEIKNLKCGEGYVLFFRYAHKRYS